MRISDWSSDVCTSDLLSAPAQPPRQRPAIRRGRHCRRPARRACQTVRRGARYRQRSPSHKGRIEKIRYTRRRSEEHTSELQSLMRISYAVFCLKKKNQYNNKKRIQQDNNTKTSTYTKHKNTR